MALDLILASEGGVCKAIGSECCTYISDASSAVHDFVADTERGIKELHEDHGWNPFGGMKSMTGFWGASFLKGLIWIIGSIIRIVIIIILIVMIFKVCNRKVITTLVSVKSHRLSRSVSYTTLDCSIR